MFRILDRNSVWFIALILFPIFVSALPSDDKLPMQITAESSEFNYKTGVTTYEGNVKVDQGTTHLTADRIVTRRNKHHKIEEAIAYGIHRPAIYSSLMKVGDPPLRAEAKIIKFYPLKSNVILEGNVKAAQGENSFHGPVIIYNMKDQTVTAPPSKTGHATMLIEAKDLNS